MKDLYKITSEDIAKLSSESMLADTCAGILPADQKAAAEFAGQLDKALPPTCSLGQLREIALRYTAAVGNPKITRLPITLIFCADHGVAEENVSAYPPETTLHMTTNYMISKGAAANAFSNFVHSQFLVADMGIRGDAGSLPALLHWKIASGTKNSARGAAMSRQEAVQSLCSGILLGRELAAAGCTIMLPGEMGIANTTTSAAITAALCGLPAEKTTGRGTNISDMRLKKKIAIVEQILQVNQPNAADPVDVLAKTGGFELGAIAGLILGAASQRAVTVLDGFNTGAAALIAAALCPNVKDYLIASHLGGEQGHPHILKELGLSPVMTLDIKLGEAIGSTLTADLLIKTLVGAASLHASQEEQGGLLGLLRECSISPKPIILTDKTFDFYTNTMPAPDKNAMEKCQLRLDNLAKPIYCLGTIEKIAVQLSGILGEELPGTDTGRALLLIGTDNTGTAQGSSIHTGAQGIMLSSFAKHTGVNVTTGNLTLGHSQMDAFEFGRREGERLALSSGIVGLGMADTPASLENIADILLSPDGSLRWDTTSFLSSLDSSQQLMAAAVLGAMVAAAHNRSLVILDDAATAAVAGYAVRMLPELKDFLLPIQPQLYQMDIKAPGITALAGISLAVASLHALNDMKTFAEAQVAVANDGPGKGKQYL